MTTTQALWKDIVANGLWKNNPALVQILGLCPLLAVSNTAINGLGLGLATLLVLTLSNTAVSLVRRWTPREIRIPIFVMLIASLVTATELLMNAYTYNLYLTLGIFVPLIVTNCVIIGRAESFASRNSVLIACVDGFMQGLGFAAVLFTLGAIREILGAGTLFSGAEHLFGEGAQVVTLHLIQWNAPLLLAILPPGAFIVLGLLIAGKNAYDAKQKIKQLARQNTIATPKLVPSQSATGNTL